MNRLLDQLSGGDLRSIGNANAVVKQVRSQIQFDKLLEGLFHSDRLIVMRAADAIEKISQKERRYLLPHKRRLLGLLNSAVEKELKWHVALLVPRLPLTASELKKARTTLTCWALDKSESRIVRVNSIQGLFGLLERSPGQRRGFHRTLAQLEREAVPSITARIRRLNHSLE